jgi:hypothetical protein
MMLRKRQTRPVDRCVGELQRKIGALEREIRSLEQRRQAAETQKVTKSEATDSSLESASNLIKAMLQVPSRQPPEPTYRVRQDLFDAVDPVKELDAGAMPAVVPAAARTDVAKAVEPVKPAVEPQRKLATYLSAGTFRNQHPLKRSEREARHRILTWMGLSCVVIWIMFVVLR